MLEAFKILFNHMNEKHPDSNVFGDSFLINNKGIVIYQVCQLCGEILVDKRDIADKLRMGSLI